MWGKGRQCTSRPDNHRSNLLAGRRGLDQWAEAMGSSGRTKGPAGILSHSRNLKGGGGGVGGTLMGLQNALNTHSLTHIHTN